MWCDIPEQTGLIARCSPVTPLVWFQTSPWGQDAQCASCPHGGSCAPMPEKIGQGASPADTSSGAQTESSEEALQMTALKEALLAVQAERGQTQAMPSSAEAVDEGEDELEKMLVQRHERRKETASMAAGRSHTLSRGSLASATSSSSSISSDAERSFRRIRWRDAPSLPDPESRENSQGLSQTRLRLSNTNSGTRYRTSPSVSAPSSTKVSPTMRPERAATAESIRTSVQAMSPTEPAAATSTRDC